jgi:hypothetical protein
MCEVHSGSMQGTLQATTVHFLKTIQLNIYLVIYTGLHQFFSQLLLHLNHSVAPENLRTDWHQAFGLCYSFHS